MDCSSDHLIKELNEKWVHIEILDFWCFGKSEHSVKLRDLSWFKTGYWRYYICDVSCWVCSYYEHWRNTHPIMTSSIQNTTNASVFSMLDFIKQASEKLSIYKLIWMKNSDIAIWEQQNSHPNQNLSETRGNISTFMSTSPLIGSDALFSVVSYVVLGHQHTEKKVNFSETEWNSCMKRPCHP